MTRLILIRHGETDYNLKARYCGFSNPSLNNKGLWQSERLAIRLKYIKVDKVYSSDLKRAYETSKIIFKNNPIKKIRDFREMNFGIFEGLRYEEIIKVHPTLYKDWIDNPMEVRISEAEGLKDFIGRIKEALSLILSEAEGSTIAIVTHSGPIRIILCDILKYDLRMFWQIEQEPGALNIIDYSKELPPVIAKMNDVSHLSTQK